MNLFKKLADLFQMEESEVLTRLNLTNESSTKEIKDALGVYGLFLDKLELESYIKNKVQNKIKENEELQQKLNDVSSALEKLTNDNLALNNDYNSISSSVKSLLSNEWKKSKLPEFDFSTLNIKDIDLSNIPKTINELVKKHNIQVPTIEPSKIENQENFSSPLQGTQTFSVGAKRIKN